VHLPKIGGAADAGNYRLRLFRDRAAFPPVRRIKRSPGDFSFLF
jgi:hypothetical protein